MPKHPYLYLILAIAAFNGASYWSRVPVKWQVPFRLTAILLTIPTLFYLLQDSTAWFTWQGGVMGLTVAAWVNGCFEKEFLDRGRFWWLRYLVAFGVLVFICLYMVTLMVPTSWLATFLAP